MVLIIGALIFVTLFILACFKVNGQNDPCHNCPYRESSYCGQTYDCPYRRL